MDDKLQHLNFVSAYLFKVFIVVEGGKIVGLIAWF